MSDITIIGLGLMGSAIVRAFKMAEVSQTVWNRSPQKAEAIETDNVAAAKTLPDAVLASPVSIICVDDPRSVFTLFADGLVEPLLDGRTIVQLSTCLPKQAREAATWLATKNAGYLDGAIHCGPDDLGTRNGKLLISGPSATFRQIAGLLDHLGGEVNHVGDQIAAASTLDLAWLSTRFGEFMGMLHAANVCETEGIEIEKFVSMFPNDARIQHHVGTIRDGSYDQRSATLSVWRASLELLRQQAIDADMNAEFPDFVGNLFDQAMRAGLGEEHVMALFKVLRGSVRTGA